jgi:asparagine synthetase B (glutamine-hydrolysing)
MLAGGDSNLLAIFGGKHKAHRSVFEIFNGEFVERDAFDDFHYAQAVTDEYGMELHAAPNSENDFVDSIANAIH